jgi:ferric iron reductase protein FhuF
MALKQESNMHTLHGKALFNQISENAPGIFFFSAHNGVLARQTCCLNHLCFFVTPSMLL